MTNIHEENSEGKYNPGVVEKFLYNLKLYNDSRSHSTPTYKYKDPTHKNC